MNLSIPHVHRFADKEAVSRAAADLFTERAAAAQAARGRFTVALSGGSTPKRLYELLTGPPWTERIDWNRVELCFGDERSVGPEDPDSNYRMANEALFEPLGISPARVHRMEGERANLDAAALAYEDTLARVFGLARGRRGPPPSFDLVLLGMGPDGHTASLFPHTRGLHERERWCVANQVPQHDTWRLTLTYPVLDRAATVLFLVAGKDKTEPLAEVLEGAPDAERLPSQGIRPVCGELLFYVDEVAASGLERH